MDCLTCWWRRDGGARRAPTIRRRGRPPRSERNKRAQRRVDDGAATPRGDDDGRRHLGACWFIHCVYCSGCWVGRDHFSISDIRSLFSETERCCERAFNNGYIASAARGTTRLGSPSRSSKREKVNGRSALSTHNPRGAGPLPNGGDTADVHAAGGPGAGGRAPRGDHRQTLNPKP